MVFVLSLLFKDACLNPIYIALMIGRLINVEQLVEWALAGQAEVFGTNLP
jgi:hypothetical protein